MDDLKYLFWVVIALVYFISRARKKAAANRPKPPEFEQSKPVSEGGHKPVTFEELLKEIQRSKTQAPKPYSPPEPAYSPPKQDYVDYDDDIGSEEKDLEKEYDYRKEETFEIYQKAKSEAFNRKSLEETVKLSDTPMKFGQFKEYAKEERHPWAEAISSDFRNMDSLKKALIMNEILNRRY